MSDESLKIILKNYIEVSRLFKDRSLEHIYIGNDLDDEDRLRDYKRLQLLENKKNQLKIEILHRDHTFFITHESMAE